MVPPRQHEVSVTLERLLKLLIMQLLFHDVEQLPEEYQIIFDQQIVRALGGLQKEYVAYNRIRMRVSEPYRLT
jgi:hypothetical protein